MRNDSPNPRNIRLVPIGIGCALLAILSGCASTDKGSGVSLAAPDQPVPVRIGAFVGDSVASGHGPELADYLRQNLKHCPGVVVMGDSMVRSEHAPRRNWAKEGGGGEAPGGEPPEGMRGQGGPMGGSGPGGGKHHRHHDAPGSGEESPRPDPPSLMVGTVLRWDRDSAAASDSFRIAVQVRLVDVQTGRSFWQDTARCAVARTDSTKTTTPRAGCLERLTERIAQELVRSKRPSKG